MARYPYAAKTLIAEATEHKPRTKAKPIGDPDGLNVYRTFRFNKDTGNWLKPLLEFLDDKRIASFDLTKDGLDVTFTSDARRADDRSIYMLGIAESVVDEKD